MKLPLSYFIPACILMGAVGVPWAWRAYQARRAAEIERLEKELAQVDLDLFYTESKYSHPTVTAARKARVLRPLRQRLTRIQDRLEKLTGRRPQRSFASEATFSSQDMRSIIETWERIWNADVGGTDKAN